MKHTALPEILKRQDGVGKGGWTVKSGPPSRGQVFTNLDTRQMTVPETNTPEARVIRAHEMAHARLSPANKATVYDQIYEYERNINMMKLLDTAEEARINAYLQTIGFDTDLLVDGSETWMARQATASDNPIDAINVFLATLFDSSHAEVEQILIETHPAWEDKLEHLETWAKHFFRTDADPWNTEVDDTFGTYGFRQTWQLARKAVDIFESVLRTASTPPSMDGTPTLAGTKPMPGVSKPSLKPSGEVDTNEILEGTGNLGKGSGSGEPSWGELRWDHPPLTQDSVNLSGRKHRKAAIGRNPKYLANALTDPHRRVFSGRKRAAGGIYVIDHSGSMSLTREDIIELLKAAPAAKIIAYSEGSENLPTISLLADKGRYSTEWAIPHSGNGVDLPALQWAIKNSRSNEPRVWITDGGVCVANGNDSIATLQCVAAARHAGFSVLPDIETAIEYATTYGGKAPYPMWDENVMNEFAMMSDWSVADLETL